jgi:hypothetical protein
MGRERSSLYLALILLFVFPAMNYPTLLSLAQLKAA